jgi:hypothetical protein
MTASATGFDFRDPGAFGFPASPGAMVADRRAGAADNSCGCGERGGGHNGSCGCANNPDGGELLLSGSGDGSLWAKGSPDGLEHPQFGKSIWNVLRTREEVFGDAATPPLPGKQDVQIELGAKQDASNIRSLGLVTLHEAIADMATWGIPNEPGEWGNCPAWCLLAAKELGACAMATRVLTGKDYARVKKYCKDLVSVYDAVCLARYTGCPVTALYEGVKDLCCLKVNCATLSVSPFYHCWIEKKDCGQLHVDRYEVWQWNWLSRLVGAPTIPSASVPGGVQVLGRHLAQNLMARGAPVGGGATETIWEGCFDCDAPTNPCDCLNKEIPEYAHRDRYVPVPGPNCNTFVSHMLMLCGLIGSSPSHGGKRTPSGFKAPGWGWWPPADPMALPVLRGGGPGAALRAGAASGQSTAATYKPSNEPLPW